MSNNLSIEKKIFAVAMLCEGNSIRAIERMTAVHRDTIMRLGVRIGQGCASIMDDMMRGLSIPQVQVDEMWGFIGSKNDVAKETGKAGTGDIWVWVAMDADTKLIPSFLTGKRDKYHARTFMDDLASRLINRPQISSDALASYPDAIERAFGDNVDYGVVVKTFTHTDLYGAGRYTPPDVLKVKKVSAAGHPDMRRCSTSFVEKQNHTMRMHCRRLSRLTNAFSKKRENFDAAVALHFAYYNLCRIHGTLRCTPAMQAGLEKQQWTVTDLIERIDG
ncbi:MAG: DDE-type integrase/transposase/recombinase [Akkermansiaceae bacterium]|nr:DDE-type integrase/transposase/recombinase [Akkermansiaceae bacterium]